MRTIVALGALAALAACGGGDQANLDTTAVTDTSSGLATPAAAPTQLTDANIVAKGLMSDSMEIQLATIAQQKATNPRVREYARTLLTEHRKDAQEMTSLATSLSLTPQPPAGDTSAHAMMTQRETLAQMPKGPEFDAAFVEANVALHQKAVADAQQMQAQAQSPQLKAHLEKMLPVLQKHLEQAQQLQTSLVSGSGSGTGTSGAGTQRGGNAAKAP